MTTYLREFTHRLATADIGLLEKLNRSLIVATNTYNYIQDMMNGNAPEAVAYPKRVADLAYMEWFRMTGEAAKRIPAEIRAQYPDVPWKEFFKIRDAVAHIEHDPDISENLLDYIHKQNRLIREIDDARKAVSHISLGPNATAETKKALLFLKEGINCWAGSNAVHFGVKNAFMNTLKEEEKPFFEEFFNASAQWEFKGAFNLLLIMSGNLSSQLSPLFKKTCGKESGYIDFDEHLKERRNAMAHSDIHPNMTLKNKHARYTSVIKWAKKNGNPTNVEQIYYTHLTKGLSDDKIAVLEDIAEKMQGQHFRQDIRQQGAFLMALSEVAKDLKIDTLQVVAKTALPLVGAKRSNITVASLDKKIPVNIEFFVSRIAEAMRNRLAVKQSQAIT